MPFTMYHSPQRSLARRRLACLLSLVTLPGCARAPVDLHLSPSRGPTVRAALGPLTVSGTLGGGAVIGVGRGRTVARGNVPKRSTWPRAVYSASAAQVLATADRYVGTPYRYGGGSPAEGFDCSGFVQFVYGRHGVQLPRTSDQQATAGHWLPREIAALEPGDLMFFAAKGRGVDHVAIYAGEGRIIHASAGSGRVRYDGLETDRGEWLLKRFVTSRRVLGRST